MFLQFSLFSCLFSYLRWPLPDIDKRPTTADTRTLLWELGVFVECSHPLLKLPAASSPWPFLGLCQKSLLLISIETSIGLWGVTAIDGLLSNSCLKFPLLPCVQNLPSLHCLLLAYECVIHSIIPDALGQHSTLHPDVPTRPRFCEHCIHHAGTPPFTEVSFTGIARLLTYFLVS